MEYAVVTAIGPDRIGIMDRLAHAASSCGANIEETRAAILGGEFAVIMLVTGQGGVAEALEPTMRAEGEALGLSISIKKTNSPAQPKGLPYLIESISLDTPGIVLAISGLLKSRGINIEDLESSVQPAPLSGSPMFLMRVGINLVPGENLIILKEELAKIAKEYDLDIDVRPLKPTDIL